MVWEPTHIFRDGERKNMHEILELIENVDPSDTAKLDEIDLMVCHFLIMNGMIGRNLIKKTGSTVTTKGDVMRLEYEYKSRSQYTRSRDALKSIRPEGWEYFIGIEDESDPKDPHRLTRLQKEPSVVVSNLIATLATEELAELHAIIQAIEFEKKLDAWNKME